MRTPKTRFCLDFRSNLSPQYGSFWMKWLPWSIGFQAANLGKKIDGYKLPAKLGLGGCNRPAIQHGEPIVCKWHSTSTICFLPKSANFRQESAPNITS